MYSPCSTKDPMSSKNKAGANAPSQSQALKGNQKKKKANKPRSSEKVDSVPAALSMKSVTAEPRIRADARSTRIKHKELVTTLSGSVAFAVGTTLVLNPGMSASFPWLSTQATGWEQYRFHKLEIHYIPRCPTSKPGSVLLSPDYDSNEGSPPSELIAGSYKDSVEGASWERLCLEANVQAMFPIGPRKFIRSGPVAYADYKTYDAGKAYLCSGYQDDTTAIGKIWIEYDVELFVPQTDISAPTLAAGSVSVFQKNAAQTFTNGVAADVTFPTESTNPLGITVASNSLFTLPRGVYEVVVELAATDSALENFSVSADIYADSVLQRRLAFGPSLWVVNESRELVGHAYLVSNGSTVVRVSCICTGAAGTLRIYGDTNVRTLIAFRMI